MAEARQEGGSEFSNGLALLAAVICGFAGFSQGGWELAIVAALVGGGAVKLAFAFVRLLIPFLVTGVILVVIGFILVDHVEWLERLFN
jgi:hypothetical protein